MKRDCLCLRFGVDNLYIFVGLYVKKEKIGWEFVLHVDLSYCLVKLFSFSFLFFCMVSDNFTCLFL